MGMDIVSLFVNSHIIYTIHIHFVFQCAFSPGVDHWYCQKAPSLVGTDAIVYIAGMRTPKALKKRKLGAPTGSCAGCYIAV